MRERTMTLRFLCYYYDYYFNVFKVNWLSREARGGYTRYAIDTAFEGELELLGVVFV
jgi:hypothetical protein